MPPRIIQPNEGLDSVWEELVYTRARLQANDAVRSLVTTVAEAIDGCKTLREEQFTQWEGEIVAQAAVDEENAQLDALTRRFADRLETHEDDRQTKSARYRLYFKSAPNDVIRLGLDSQIKKSKPWLQSLPNEEEADIRAFLPLFQTRFTQGEAALEARSKAVIATAEHRVRRILTFIDDVNALRLSLYGQLILSARNLGFKRDWAEGFFRKRSAEDPESDPAPTPPSPPTP